ncbi:MAG TPA: hypothetical protein VLN74_10360 [Ilumatobacteraceae bacterium]|nr:hypothetical protein [Ilumatobacteraceae bacterium]
MSDFRAPARPGVGEVRPDPLHDGRPRGDDQFEHERIGIHNEAETVRRDRIRWGPIWAGIVTAVGSYLFLQLALVAFGIVEFGDSAGDDAIASGIAALIAFFVGGMTTGATAMWQGADDGVLHGIVMWFAALVSIIVFSAVGSGLALGSFDTTDVFDEFSLDEVDVDQANDDAQDAAGKALLALSLGLAAAAAGGALGAKMWPKDDAFVDVVRRKTQ